MTSILAIDPSITLTGWAYGTPGQKPVTGTISFSKFNTSYDRVWAQAFVWGAKLFAEMKPDYVAIESPVFNSGRSHKTDVVLEGLNSQLRSVAYLRTNNPALMFASSTATKVMTGKGKYPTRQEKKAAVFAACLALGWVEDTDPFDISDALAIFVAAAKKLDPTFKPQREAS